MQPPRIIATKDLLPKDIRLVDVFDQNLRELFFVRNPQQSKKNPSSIAAADAFIQSTKIQGVWIVYPEEQLAVHTLPEAEYFELRTARNHHLITHDEQTAYRSIRIGIAGLSVGSSIVEVLIRTGGPQKIKISDFDTIEISNLNRVKASLHEVGENKTQVTARAIWSVDPYAQLELFEQGVTRDNLERFINEPKLDVFIDAMDSLDLKVLSRVLCRRFGIPVLMGTDVADAAILDVERFDLEPERRLFHGNVNEEQIIGQTGNLSPQDWLKIAGLIVGSNIPLRMKQSLPEIGKSLAGLPQLGSSAMLAGIMVSYAVRRIANQQPLVSGKYHLDLQPVLDADFNNSQATQ